MNHSQLLKKYDVPAPRYTSYPTVPYWEDSPTSSEWTKTLNSTFERALDKPWSLYIHIPFCESLCTYCGCNTTITRNHNVEKGYLDDILKEWELYKKEVPQMLKAPLCEIHLGGGTPTFFSAENLEILVSTILRDVTVSADFEGALEVDPRKTNVDQLKTLYKYGFKRISLGVQDFNHSVQEIVNRIQSYEITKDLTDASRKIGYESVNFDLIYGMPLQTKEFMINTIEKTLTLMPDRIALYSLAIVPWIKPAHRKFKDSDLPKSEDKRELYEISRKMLLDAGYKDIGMDHFSLESDELYIASQNNSLHRNFMGYTPKRNNALLGLGVSAISETDECFHQNEKILPKYQEMVQGSSLPTLRGHKLTLEDQIQRELILNLMTRWRCEIPDASDLSSIQDTLNELQEDELLKYDENTIIVTEKGKPFVRNICMALDKRLLRKKPSINLFSQSI